MKVSLSFFCGMVICGLLLFGVQSAIPIRAQTEDLSESSDNLSQSLVELLPDIEKIYREALAMPFQKARSKIYDEDIADFYDELLDRSIFSGAEDGTQ